MFSALASAILAVILVNCQPLMAEPNRKNADDSATASDSKATEKPVPVKTRRLSDEELDSLLTGIEKELGTLKSLRTEFVQEKHLSIFSDVIKAKGLCLFRAPDMVRFEISEPFQSVLVARHKKVAKFEFIKGKWQKLKLPSRDIVLMVTRQIATWLRGRFRDKNGIYNVSATVGQDTTVILTPRDKNFRKNISAVELRLAKNKKHISSVRLLEPGGDFTVMKFMNQQRDIKLPNEIFDTSGTAPTKIKLPKGEPDTSDDAKAKSPNTKKD